MSVKTIDQTGVLVEVHTENAMVPYKANAIDVIRHPEEIAVDLSKASGWSRVAMKLKDEKLLNQAAIAAVEARTEAVAYYKANVAAPSASLKQNAPFTTQGVNGSKKIAGQLGVSQQTISKWAKFLEENGDKAAVALFNKWHDFIWAELKEPVEKAEKEAGEGAVRIFLAKLFALEGKDRAYAEKCIMAEFGFVREADLLAVHVNHKREIAELRANLKFTEEVVAKKTNFAPAPKRVPIPVPEMDPVAANILSRYKDCSSKWVWLQERFRDGATQEWPAQARGVHTQIVDDFYAASDEVKIAVIYGISKMETF